MNPIDLSSRAMLVTLHISLWTARKKDKKESLDTAQRNHVAPSMVATYKSLLPENAASYAKVVTASSAAREYFYRYTSPWSDEGSRILAASNFMEFSGGMNKCKADVEQAVLEFLADWDALLAQAQVSLNGMFRIGDYPQRSELKSKFGIKCSVFPMPNTEDFRVSLSAEAADLIKSQLQDTLDASQDFVRQDMTNRLLEVLTSMYNKLSTADGVYKNTLFSNVEDACDTVEKLNIFNDPCIARAVEDTREKVLRFRPQQCRDSRPHRKAAAAQVEEILRVMGAKP